MKTKKTFKKRFVVFGVALIFILFGLFVRFNVNPIIFSLSEVNARAVTTTSIAEALNVTVKNNVSYADLITVINDSDGKIRMLQANTVRINALAREACERAQSNIAIRGKNGIDIPVGSLTGLPLFTGKGTAIKVRIEPIGAVECTFKSDLEANGINQTLHRIYAEFYASVNVVLPGQRQTVQTVQQMLLCESVLIGEIPSTYLIANSIDEALNLLPNVG